jgi:murein L,D-transpeptidase YafK
MIPSTLKKFNCCFFIVFLLFVTVCSACSMQKSGSKVDTASMESRFKDKQPPQEKKQNELAPLKVDYLTPVASISNPEIYVYKEKRRMYIIQSNVLVRDYPIGLGFSPRGDKLKSGDGRTPEGDFRICVKNPVSRFIKSLGLNYPQERHAQRARVAGMITPIQFKDIIISVERNMLPPWNTALGGQIFIHAGGAHKDWTEGCVALYNRDMDELFVMANVGTPVIIRP